MGNKSFIDLLFILLLGTFVMLSESLRVGAIDTAPADVGGGGAVVEDPGNARVVVVTPEAVTLEDQVVTGLDDLVGRLAPGEFVLLTPGLETLPHQRVMDVWAELDRQGVEVKLAVQPPVDAEAGTRSGSVGGAG